MSLQITSGVNSSIPLMGVASSGTTANSGATAQVAPSYQLDFAGLSRASVVGLASPSAVGDLEILFARISSALKESLGALRDANDVAQAELFRGQIGQAMAAFSLMDKWGAVIDREQLNVRKQTDIENEQTARRETAKSDKSTIEGKVSTWEGQIKANERDISSYRGSLGTLQTEENQLLGSRQSLWTERSTLLSDPVKNARRLSEIERDLTTIGNRLTDIDRDQQWYNTAIGQREATNTQLREELATFGAQIKELDGVIKDADDKVKAAVKSRKDSEALIDSTNRAMVKFIESTVLLASAANGKTRADMGRDAAQITVESSGFENLLSGMIQALSQLGESLSQAMTGMDVALNTGGAGLNQTQSSPDRFGQLSAPVARAIAFAGMIAGVLGPLADMLGGLGRGMGMQTAGSLATAGEPRVRLGV